MKGSREDYIMGCVFGQFIGDALGAYVKSEDRVIEVLLKELLKMPGGGAFGVAKG